MLLLSFFSLQELCHSFASPWSLSSPAAANLNPACFRFRSGSYWLPCCPVPTGGLCNSNHDSGSSSLRIRLQRSGSARLTAPSRHLLLLLSSLAYLSCWSLLRLLTRSLSFHACSSGRPLPHYAITVISLPTNTLAAHLHHFLHLHTFVSTFDTVPGFFHTLDIAEKLRAIYIIDVISIENE